MRRNRNRLLDPAGEVSVVQQGRVNFQRFMVKTAVYEAPITITRGKKVDACARI